MARKTAGTSNAWMIAVYALLAGLSLAMIGMGISQADAVKSAVFLGAGVLALVITSSAAIIAHLVAHRSAGRAPAVTDGSRVEALLAEIHEHTMLTDNAKRVLYRAREMEMLRRAIEQDIASGEYNAALTLCDELANLFGYRQEAEAFRTRILQARHERYEASIHAAMDQFEALLSSRDWALAHQEAARIRRLFPDSHMIHELDSRILAARDEHKKELEQQFVDAAQREDVEAAMSLLKQLDRYMTREEAERLTAVAQEVVTKHRRNLEIQFRLAVSDRRWADAAIAGERIIGEFPNTKMAEEVRGMLVTIRTRATEAALAGEHHRG